MRKRVHWLAQDVLGVNAFPSFQLILHTLTSSPHAVRALPSGRAATAPPEKKGSTADSRRHDARLVGAVDAIEILFFSFRNRVRNLSVELD